MSFNPEEAPGLFAINIAVAGVRQGEENGVFGPDTLLATLRGFASHNPHRLFFDPDNPTTTGRVAIFSEIDEGEKMYRAYMETAFMLNGQRQTTWRIHGARALEIVEHEIERWRQDHALSADLLRNPTRVYQVAGENTVLHVAETPSGLLTWEYRLTDAGIRSLYSNDPTEVRTDLNFPDRDLLQLPSVPSVIIEYSSLAV